MFSALFGYAVGTVQVLFLDWFRSRVAHARQLRLIRADLRNAASFTKKFAWTGDTVPDDDFLPRPPFVSQAFLSTLAATDFTLTDEHDDDNTQQSLLSITDGFGLLAQYQARFLELTDEVRRATELSTKRDLRERAFEYTKEYDRRLDEVLFLISDALRDLDRRLPAATLWHQLNRPIGRLPRGINPPPLKPQDDRVRAFAARASSEELQ